MNSHFEDPLVRHIQNSLEESHHLPSDQVWEDLEARLDGNTGGPQQFPFRRISLTILIAASLMVGMGIGIDWFYQISYLPTIRHEIQASNYSRKAKKSIQPISANQSLVSLGPALEFPANPFVKGPFPLKPTQKANYGDAPLKKLPLRLNPSQSSLTRPIETNESLDLSPYSTPIFSPDTKENRKSFQRVQNNKRRQSNRFTYKRYYKPPSWARGNRLGLKAGFQMGMRFWPSALSIHRLITNGTLASAHLEFILHPRWRLRMGLEGHRGQGPMGSFVFAGPPQTEEFIFGDTTGVSAIGLNYRNLVAPLELIWVLNPEGRNRVSFGLGGRIGLLSQLIVSYQYEGTFEMVQVGTITAQTFPFNNGVFFPLERFGLPYTAVYLDRSVKKAPNFRYQLGFQWEPKSIVLSRETIIPTLWSYFNVSMGIYFGQEPFRAL